MMYKVKNHTGSIITINDINILPKRTYVFESFNNPLQINKLIGSRCISVTCEPIISAVTSVDKVVETVQTPNLIESNVEENSTIDITTKLSTKKKRIKDNNSEVENSKSTKGDMNNATD